jgi:anti-sigma B factor antagonist
LICKFHHGNIQFSQRLRGKRSNRQRWQEQKGGAMSAPTPPSGKKRLTIEHVGDVVVVGFVDRRILDEQNIQIIADQLFSLVEDQNRHKLILNFSNVEYMSSAALGKLITLHKKMTAAKGKMVLCGIIPQIFEVFAITKLDKIFNIQKDLDAALKVFQ